MTADGSKGNKTFRDWLRLAASPAILFYALPWLMILLVIGTVAQKDLGIYEAHRLYFSSWIFWVGPLPLPGAYPTLGLISLCLLAKFLLYSPWRMHQAGIILSHFGVLILMIGGLVTAATQEEGYLSLREDESAQAVSDYHDRVLTIELNGEAYASMPYEELKAKEVLHIVLPFRVDIEALCRNCRPATIEKGERRRGLAKKLALQEGPPEKEDEANLYGMTFKVRGAGRAQNGTYVMMEEMPFHPEITSRDGDVYRFTLERRKTVLPFTVTLGDFRRDMHPGTDMARGFSSDVVVKDGALEWPAVISMNEPLRYKGYTLYQSSFSIRPDGEFSVFSVVHNKGRVYPYIASAVIFAGLLIHVLIRLRRKGEA